MLARVEDSTNARRRGRVTLPAAWLLAATAFALVAAPVGWFATDALEADDDFCNSCHLPDETPLHEGIRADFDQRPAASLAGRHGDVRLPHRPESPDFRCIDCHGGVGLVGRAEVKLLSVKDTLLYVTGRFEEPDGMSWPLDDADCSQCHASFPEKGQGFDGEAFHDQPGHNVDLGVDCVACHTAHERGDARQWFLAPDAVRARCAECHVEYQPVP